MAGGHTRAGFLGTGAVALGGAALAGAWRTDRAAASTASAAAGQVPNGTVTEGAFDARFAGDAFWFELDGAASGKIASVSGANAYADVVVEKIGPDNIARKHIAGVKYEDFSVSCGTGMSKGFYDWIKSSFDGKPLRRTGSVVAYDTSGLVTGSGQFTNALVSEIGFPALDASSKDAAKMTIKFQPEVTRFAPRSGKAPALGGATPDISAGVFKLDIDGLPTARVATIDSFTWKQDIVANPGDGTNFQYEPGAIEVPNLAFYFQDTIDQAWIDYFQDFVVNGNNDSTHERSGTLHLQDKKANELFTLSFSNLGIFKLTPEKVEAGSDDIRRIKAEMYCESISFQYTQAATFG
jgi:phage tail-like protein